MAWDHLEIQQSVKEHALEVSAMQEVALLALAEETEPDAADIPAEPEPTSDIPTDPEISNSAEPVKKKSRRRPRHRKRKPVEATAEIAPSEASDPEAPSSAPAPPVPSARTPRLPVKPLKIVRALPDEFYPVEPGEEDVFAFDSEGDNPEDDD